jgi:transcriptional regulator GlxA family with amidase domain
MSQSSASRDVVIVVFPGVQSLDVTGPLEVFNGAQRLLTASSEALRGAVAPAQARGYRTIVASLDGAPLTTSSGLTIVPHTSLQEVSSRIDTLIVAGGDAAQTIDDRALLGAIAASARSARRIASVCTGAFLLAAAGLLDGRRATTHWAYAAELARRYPAVEVDPEPIFLRDGELWTSAGVTAGMDLALAMVEEDLDRDAALLIARHLVLFLRRPGNQSQFSATLSAQAPQGSPLRELQRFAAEHLHENLSVEALAERAHMSPRHFARSFRAQTGVTPARYVENLRLEAARRMLEDTDLAVSAVAGDCGFGTAETMRRAFLRTLGVGPADYRRRFHTTTTVVPAVV